MAIETIRSHQAKRLKRINTGNLITVSASVGSIMLSKENNHQTDVNNFRYYNICTFYDEWPYILLVYFRATKENKTLFPPEDIKYSVLREYLANSNNVDILLHEDRSHYPNNSFLQLSC